MSASSATTYRLGNILINEIAPRPHNSGHYTIEACPISQYDAHIKAILGLPIPGGQIRFHTRDMNAIMLNILGGSHPVAHERAVDEAISMGVSLHMYGKGDGRPGRKMGHVTVIGSSMQDIEHQIQPLVELVDGIRAERATPRENLKLEQCSPHSGAAKTCGASEITGITPQHR